MSQNAAPEKRKFRKQINKLALSGGNQSAVAANSQGSIAKQGRMHGPEGP